MNRELLNKCQTMEECVDEIWRQNYIRYNSEDEGYYLKANTKIENSHFDILFAYAEKIFVDITKENNDEARKDAMMLMHNILIKWTKKEYKLKYVPSNVEELVENIFNLEVSLEITKYLCAVLNRMSKNLLYASENKNSYSRFVFCTSEKNSKNYTNVNMFELDKTYDDVTGYEIMELEQYKNRKHEEKYEDNNVYGFIYDNVCTDRDRREIEKKLNDKSYKCGVRAKALINRIDKNKDKYKYIRIDENGIIRSCADYLQFGDKLIESSSDLEKFEIIRDVIKSNKKVGEIILDCIISLDVEVYRQFFQHLKDERYIEYYVRSEGFKEILGKLLDENRCQQERLKSIYEYNKCTMLHI